MSAPQPLIAAIRTWKAGEPLPVDLYVALTNLGFDVPTLEQKYMR